MTVTDVEKNAEALTMKITSEYDAPVERCWQLWADPRQLERWGGPPTYPATFVEHELAPGCFATYFMTGPDGDRSHGWWRIVSVEAPRSLELEDGFGDEPGNAGGMPMTRMSVHLTERPDGGTRMTIESTFPSREAMEQLISMGMDQGMQEALGQIEAVLAGT
jgi:uncharacterized protein YndB with AHSA1/START domain